MQDLTQKPLTVSELNQQVKNLLEGSFSSLWVEGEISNFVCPASGHWYFSLKDDKAQVRCAMFRGHNSRMKFLPENGMHVLVQGQVSLYAGRGDYQVIVHHIEEAGIGALQRAFEQLKAKLSKEGLFNEQYKKPLPAFPQQIGVITSSTGAAIRDILSVLRRRYPLASVIIYPTLVQGEAATPSIIHAIETANQRNECDVLILARGGGSLEDLWCFNEESLARAIFASQLPIISGIGHEVDFTIADFVADHRAPTPSVAAETIAPDQREIIQSLDDHEYTLITCIQDTLDSANESLNQLYKRLQRQHPEQLLQDQHEHLRYLFDTLCLSQRRLLEKKESKFKELMRTLNAVSPLATLGRGYSVTKYQGHVLKDSQAVNLNDQVEIRLHKGMLSCTVTDKCS